MDTRDPDLGPGAFGDVDTRGTHPTPGDEKDPYPPIEAPGEAIYEGAAPVLPPELSGAGGNLEGDVRRESDGHQISPPERHAPDEAVLEEPGDQVELDTVEDKLGDTDDSY